MAEASSQIKLNGLHHLALVCKDMERTVEFYTQVLGLTLKKGFDLPGYGQHFFFELPGSKPPSCLAFFWFPDAPPARPGISAPDMNVMFTSGRHPSAVGSMNHVAFTVSRDAVRRVRHRLLKSGMARWVTPIVVHGDTELGFVPNEDDDKATWISCYFAGPDGELLEVTSQTRAMNRSDDVEHLPAKGLYAAPTTGFLGK